MYGKFLGEVAVRILTRLFQKENDRMPVEQGICLLALIIKIKVDVQSSQKVL